MPDATDKTPAPLQVPNRAIVICHIRSCWHGTVGLVLPFKDAGCLRTFRISEHVIPPHATTGAEPEWLEIAFPLRYDERNLPYILISDPPTTYHVSLNALKNWRLPRD